MAEIDFAKLKEPFPAEDIEWRVQSSGGKQGKPWAMVLAYIQSRAIMDRLDTVCGPGNWRNEYRTGPDGGIICSILIRINGEWVAKEDGAENTQVEAVKGGISSALKRAGVVWGIGRYLYKLDVGWANFEKNGKYTAKVETSKGKYEWLKWNPPALPAWALPTGSPRNERPQGEQHKKHSEKKPILDRKLVEQWLNWIDAHTHRTAAELEKGWKEHLAPNMDKFPAEHQNELSIAYKDTMNFLKEKENA